MRRLLGGGEVWMKGLLGVRWGGVVVGLCFMFLGGRD